MNLNQVRKLIFNKENLTAVSITSKFGKRTYTYNGKKITDYHYGEDFGTKGKGYGLYAITDGEVYKVGKDNQSGNWIYIKYSSLGYMSFYCHLSKAPLVKKGAKVNTNTLVGYTGKTGQATGVHLHLGFKKIGSNTWLDPEDVPIKFARTTTDALNMRKTASTSGKKLLTIPKGKQVTEVIRNYKKANGYTWDKVKYNDITGYVANKYLK